MKILWFCNSPCGSVRRGNAKIIAGGWLISLEDEVKRCSGISLNVAYFSDIKEVSFDFEGVKYYPMFIGSNAIGFQRVLKRYKSIEGIDKKKIPLMLDVVEDCKPDLIHIHGTEESFGLIAQYIKDIPIVYSIQGLIAPYTEKFFSGIPEKCACKYDSLYDRLKGVGIMTLFHSFCYRGERENQYLSHAEYIFGRTFWDRNCTLALNPNRKYYVVNEILRPIFYEKRWKGFIAKDKIKIVSIISGGIYKGMETILKTALLLKKYAGINFEWHIAGYNSTDRMVRFSEKFVGVTSYSCNVIFHGRIDAFSLADLLCSSDMYVHVSHIENSPNSVCEAMILGMPIIASYAGGTVDMLQHGEEGILYQDGDPYVLAGAIVSYMQGPMTAVRYGEAARKRALLRHDKVLIVKELVDNYTLIISDFNSACRGEN